MHPRHPLKILVVAMAAIFAAPVLAQNTPSAAQGAKGEPPANMQRSQNESSASGAHPMVVGHTVILQGTVQSIDRENRRITIKGDNGQTATLKVGENVANLERLKQGDQVTARFSEAVALGILEGGEEMRPRMQEQFAQSRTIGAQPGFGATERTTIVAEVKSVDRNNDKVTLIGPRKEEITMSVQDKGALQNIEKGDKVVASFVEAAALSIDRAQTQTSGAGSSDRTGSSERGSGSTGATSGTSSSSQSDTGSSQGAAGGSATDKSPQSGGSANK